MKRPTTQMMRSTQNSTQDDEVSVKVSLNRYDLKGLPKYYKRPMSPNFENTFNSIQEETGQKTNLQRRSTSMGMRKPNTA